MEFLISVLLLVVTLVLYLYWSTKKSHEFFLKRNIPHIEPINFVFGNMKDVFLKRTSLSEIYVDFYKKLAPHRFGGVFTMKMPTIVVRDPDLIKNILIKDFTFFIDRGINTVKETDPLNYNLFSMKGDEWKNLRIKLISTFSTSKMKLMFPLLKHCGENLSQVIDQIPENETFDVHDLFARFTTDAVGSCAFGLETNSLNDPNSEFRKMGKKISEFRYATLIRSLWPNIPKTVIKLFKLTLFEKRVQDYFMEIVDKTVKHREQNNVKRNDFLDLMIALKKNNSSQKVRNSAENDDLQKFLQQIGNKSVKRDVDMTNDLLAAQAFVFFLGGFGTTTTALAYTLLELSLNQPVQDKARQEILKVLSSNNQQFTYEVFKQMTYVDLVIDETLRKYPPIGVLIRESGENYKIPNTNVIIPAGTSIAISVFGIHKDEKYYENPEEFRPERFTEEEKTKRPNYTYLPFGDGPRMCIAERFSRMQIKIGLVYALKDYSYRASPKMKFPVEFQKNFAVLSPEHGILLQRQRL